MANEVYYSGLTSSARISAVLSQTIAVKLYDTASLINHPSILKINAAPGSTAVQVPVISWGADAMASVAENASVSNTGLTTTAATLTLARQALRRQVSDLAQATAQGVPLDVTIDNIATDMVAAWNKRGTAMIGALASGFSNSVGSTGVDLSVTTFYNAIFSLQLTANSGQFVAILHNQQINDLMSSIRGEGGAIQYRADAQGVLSTKGVAARFRFLEVDFYQSSRVATANAGADRQGAMFSAGAFGYKLGNVDEIINQGMVNPADILIRSPEMFVERSRDAANGLSKMILNFYPGVAEIEDLRAVAITTDA